MKLNVKALVLKYALVWGIGVFAIASCVIAPDGVYRGFTFPPRGCVIDLLWALPDGLLLGGVAARICNRLSGAASGSVASSPSFAASS